MSTYRPSPARSAAGKKGAAARWGKAHPQEEVEKEGGDEEEGQMDIEEGEFPRSEGRRRGGLISSRKQDMHELGRKGAAARWGRQYEEEDEGEEEEGGGRMSRSDAGRRGGIVSSHKQNMHELGKKGAAARWSRRYEDENVEDDNGEEMEMDRSPNRRGSAKTRLSSGTLPAPKSSYNEDESLMGEDEDWQTGKGASRGPIGYEYGGPAGHAKGGFAATRKMDMHEIGKKGAQARWSKRDRSQTEY